MSEAIYAAHFNGSQIHEPNKHNLYFDEYGRVRLDTGSDDDIVELIWNEDKSLTIVVNVDTAFWIEPEDAENVVIVTNDGDDTIFVTGDTPSDNKLELHGGRGDDDIVGSDGEEHIEGGAGSDRLWGMGGKDVIYSNTSRSSRDSNTYDQLYGGDEMDKLHGGHTDDVHGNEGLDEFYGGNHWGSNEDSGYNGGVDRFERDYEQSLDALEFASRGGDVRLPFGAQTAEAEPDEPEPDADATDEEPSASDADATDEVSGPPLPDGDPEDQVRIFEEQLTGYYASEIQNARNNAEQYALNAQIEADSGNPEKAKEWARMAISEANRAERLLEVAQGRLAGALIQRDKVINDPESTEVQRATAREQYENAAAAVTTAEGQAAEARGFAEDARAAAGLSEDDDGTIPPSDDATTEPGTEGPEASADRPESGDEGPESGTEGSEADGEELVSEESEAPTATAGSESTDDPYDQAMDNASEGTNRQESDRRSRGRSGNFLVAMAEALGYMQAKFLGNAMKSLEIMDNLSEKTFAEDDFNGQRQHREEFLIAQSTFQADMQMFNIISQASATALRSTGEGMAAVVRKN